MDEAVLDIPQYSKFDIGLERRRMQQGGFQTGGLMEIIPQKRGFWLIHGAFHAASEAVWREKSFQDSHEMTSSQTQP